jgi:hypothetical protein
MDREHLYAVSVQCPASLFVPYLANNTIYIPAGTEIACTSARLNLQQWQLCRLDIGTIVQTTPDV